MTKTQQTYHIDGIRTPVFDLGGESSEAVVFLHGNPGSGHDWLSVLGEVGGFCRAAAPDMPGFGKAGKPADFDYTITGYARHLERLLALLGIRTAHLVLHDLGGPWGLAWAAAHPSDVASLTLINIGVLRGYRWHYLARIWRTPILGEVFQTLTTRLGFRLALRHGNPRGLPRVFVDRMYDDYDRGTRRAILRHYRALNDLDAAAEHVARVLRPLDLDTLVIWGKRDPYGPWRFAEQQREVFPRAEIVYLEDSGHWPFIDDPATFGAVLIPFLRRCIEKHGGAPA